MIWQDNRNSDLDIYFAKSVDGGNSWTNPNIKISTDDTNNSQISPSLTVDSSGSLYAVWADYRSNNWDIYFTKSVNGGDDWTNPDIMVNSENKTSMQRDPTITVDSAGTLYAAWEDNIDGDFDIHFANSTNGGANWSIPNKKINSEASGKGQYNPTIDAGISGNVFLAWEDYRNDNADIYFAKSNDGGASWNESNGSINTDSTDYDQSFPTLTVSSIGTIYVAWQDLRSGSNYDIYFAYSVDHGINWIHPNIRVNDDLMGKTQDNPIIGVGSMGNVYVAWEDYRNDHYDIYSANIESVNPFPTAEQIKVEGFLGLTPGIMHITPENPVFSFMYKDPVNDPLAQYNISVWNIEGTTLLWECNRTHTLASGENVSVTYNTAPWPDTSPSLLNGTSYKLKASVKNNTNVWGPTSEVEFHMNEVLAPITPTFPADDSLIPASITQIVSWNSPGNDSEGDTPANYSWEVATDSAFTEIIASGFGTGHESDPFDTRPSGYFYWRVNMSDGWEIGEYGNPPYGYWNFTAYSGSVPNNPPVITNKALVPQTAFDGVALVFTFTATDADSDPLSWSKISGPAWLQIGLLNGTIFGIPSPTNIGSNTFLIEVSDGKGGTDNHTLIIQVKPPSATNNPPIIINKESAPNSAAINSTLVFTFLAEDEDNDPLSWSKISGPDWLLIGPSNGTIHGMPSSEEKGDNKFTIHVTDGKGGADSHTFTIVVDGESDDEGQPDSDNLIPCIILVFILLVLILLLLLLLQKKKPKEDKSLKETKSVNDKNEETSDIESINKNNNSHSNN
jgi:hypothetical protein